MNQSETRNCQSCKNQFAIEPDDFLFYEKMQVPPPTWCPECRMQRRMSHRTERGLFKRKSDFSGKEIFSMYDIGVSFPVYAQEEWFSDAWDPMAYGRDYDFARPFFEQFLELLHKVPTSARNIHLLVDSDYSNNASSLRNCYLIFGANASEDCLYGDAVDFSKNCVDNSNVSKSELCHQNFLLTRCSRAFFSVQCEDCSDVYFSKNLRNCHDCFGCMNLRSRAYCIFNEQCTKEEYARKLVAFETGSYHRVRELLEKSYAFWLKFPHKFLEGVQNVDVSGAYIFNSKNVRYSYTIRDGEDLKHCQFLRIPTSRDCYDHTLWGNNVALTYECTSCGNGAYNVRFSNECYNEVRNLEYCRRCHNSSDLFGCIGLRNKQYCILNKQYTKEAYEQLVPKIREHMMAMPYIDAEGKTYRYGEFFPQEFSPHAYNDTIAQEHFPMSKEEVLRRGWRWRNEETRQYTITLPAHNLPDRIHDVGGDILTQTIGCAHADNCNHNCTRAFRVVRAELDFYRRLSLPLPRLCPNCRHHERIILRNSAHFYHRVCQCAGAQSENGVYANTTSHFHATAHCPKEFETSYSPDRSEIVYCEACYQNEVA